ENARNNAIESIQRENIEKSGGNANGAWAQKAITLVEETFQYQHSGDLNKLGFVLRGVEASSSQVLPSQNPNYSNKSGLLDPRSDKTPGKEETMTVTPKNP
ncbi:TPA: hypothetical protein L9K97_005104, partial [Klebsiella pneumoniae]|nr:hypothetical protein [Klebsiella pneumoniae]